MRAEPIDLDGLRLVERWLAADPSAARSSAGSTARL